MNSMTEVTNTNPKAFILTLMPFDDEFNDIYDLGIKETCNDVGAYCDRVDKQLFFMKQDMHTL